MLIFFPGAWSDTFRAGSLVFVSHRIDSANEATTSRSKRLATVIILGISSASDRQGMSTANMLLYSGTFKTYLRNLFYTSIEKIQDAERSGSVVFHVQPVRYKYYGRTLP